MSLSPDDPKYCYDEDGFICLRVDLEIVGDVGKPEVVKVTCVISDVEELSEATSSESKALDSIMKMHNVTNAVHPVVDDGLCFSNLMAFTLAKLEFISLGGRARHRTIVDISLTSGEACGIGVEADFSEVQISFVQVGNQYVVYVDVVPAILFVDCTFIGLVRRVVDLYGLPMSSIMCVAFRESGLLRCVATIDSRTWLVNDVNKSVCVECSDL